MLILFIRISSDEKERLRRLKEMKSKQVEMEAIREAELKLKRKVCGIYFISIIMVILFNKLFANHQSS